MTVVVIGSMRFPPEAMPDVRPHLARLVSETRKHDGCVEYNAAEDVNDPGLVRFSEIWSPQIGGHSTNFAADGDGLVIGKAKVH